MTRNLKLVESDRDEIDEELRANLRKALEEKAAALAVRDKAGAVVESAKRHLADVEAELRQFDSLDEHIASARATKIAEALEAGAGLDVVLDDAPELRELIIRRGECANRHSAFSQAMTRLEKTLDESNATLRARQADVDHAALAIVGHVVDVRALDLVRLEADAADLRRQLLGACVTRPPGQQIPLAPATLKLLRDDCAGALVNKNDVTRAALWNTMFSKLLHDPEARIDD
jgi:hypothetical protein